MYGNLGWILIVVDSMGLVDSQGDELDNLASPCVLELIEHAVDAAALCRNPAEPRYQIIENLCANAMIFENKFVVIYGWGRVIGQGARSMRRPLQFSTDGTCRGPQSASHCSSG
jgi:hypothetical protein